MSTVRLRRLTADIAKVREYVRRHPRVRLIQTIGDPPERYQLEYRIKSLRMVGNELQTVPAHMVEIVLPLNYPRLPPVCRMLSPVFHPNIAPHAICVGDHWGAGESLASIIMRIGEMLAYQSYNVKSPLNGEAARWVELNKDRLPLDAVSLLPEEESPATSSEQALARELNSPASPATSTGANSPPSAPPAESAGNKPASSAGSPGTATNITVQCGSCHAAYRVPAASAGRNARCSKCGQTFRCEPIAAPASLPGSQDVQP